MPKPQSKRRTTDTTADTKSLAEAVAPEGVKDTTESIVVAFILAFVFRAFVIEAFVIPTGSMAATLYGRHGTLVCSDCGWENAYGLTEPTQRQAQYTPQHTVICQNCNHPNTNLTYHDGIVQSGGKYLKTRPNSEAGDRILVFKWPFDLAFSSLGPQRWDVTVFKNPANGDENFIKRLVGLPGEVLEVIDGDVYTVPFTDLSEASRNALERHRHIKHEWVRSGFSSYQHQELLKKGPPESVLDELADKLTVRRKTEKASESLWIPVYDHDFPPMSTDRGQPHWKAVAAIVDGPNFITDDRKLTFNGANGGRSTAVFSGKSIYDQNAYNINVPERLQVPVSDLRLDAVVCPSAGDGKLQISLFKGQFEFAALLKPNGDIALIQYKPGYPNPVTLASGVIHPWSANRPFEVSLRNADYRVSLHIDGQELLATTREQYAPNIRRLRATRNIMPTPAPQITAENLDVTLRHVALYRDEYYISDNIVGERNAPPSKTISGWGTQSNPILLRDHEYYMLGDNSIASKDSRLWDRVGGHLVDRGDAFQLGTVPEDQLIGKAFFVYWPSGLRPQWIPVLENMGVIPNVGRMRWIK